MPAIFIICPVVALVALPEYSLTCLRPAIVANVLVVLADGAHTG